MLFYRFFSTQLLLLKTFQALKDLVCADVPLRNCSLRHSLTHNAITLLNRRAAF